MNKKRVLALILCLCMILTPVLSAGAIETDQSVTETVPFTQVENQMGLLQDPTASDLAVEQAMVDDDGMISVIIVMEGPSILEENSAAVMNEITMAKINAMEQNQAAVVDTIEKDVLNGEELEVTHSYTWLLNGIAAEIPYSAMAQIRAIKGVAQVVVQPVYELCEATVDTVADGVMVGRESTWANGYTGQGMKIAVIDTGLDLEHQNFQALSEDRLTEDSATAESIAPLLDGLNASARVGGLTIEEVYHNTKVVFGFNYADNRTDVSHNHDTSGDHGTHVAGIAAANKVEGSDVVGVAPDAQLYIMKVFGYERGGYASDIIAALEDALILQVDVVNMSLGSASGFTTSGIELIDTIYARVSETNTVLSISAGNNYNAGYTNLWGTNANLSSNPDNAVIGEPAVYQNAMSVASVENWMIQRNYILVSDGYQMGFVDTAVSYGLPAIMDLEGEYEVVAVPNFGAAADYEGLDVTGKIALVQRGAESFVAKVENAQAAGAIACIVWNNTSDEFGMDLTGTTASIPAVSITMADGAYLTAALAEGKALTLSFPHDLASIPSSRGYQMSDFSSWGAAPDLTLEPDITAPGGNIYSTINGGEYGLMSGTSMAAPNISGITALVMQYAKENLDGDIRTLVQNLMVSTSVPLAYGEDGLYYSPRSQGSGLANAYNAVTTGAYLTVEGSDMPKVSLGDDAAKTGVYGYTFRVHNFSNGDLFYDLSTVVQSEDVISYGDIHFMASAPIALNASVSQTSGSMVLVHDVDNSGAAGSHDAYLILQNAGTEGDWTSEAFRYDVNGDEAVSADDVQAYLDALVGNESAADLEETVFRVAAGSTADVTVSITLNDEAKTWLDTYYPNGGYVEGFTFLTALNSGSVDLSLPYLAFYGSWDSAPILDDGNYWDLLNAEEGEVVGNQYYNVLFTNFYGQPAYTYAGLNAYVEEPFDPAHISVSPNGDGFYDTIDDIYTSLLRNAATLTYRYTNVETGEIYYEQTVGHVSKSAYSTSYGQIVPTIYSWYEGAIDLWDWKDAQGNDLANNTKLLLEIEVTGAYEGATSETWSVPVTVDLEAPILDGLVKTTAEDGTVSLTLTFRENHAAAVAALLSSNGSKVYAMESLVDPEPGEDGYRTYSVTYDITGLEGKLMIVLSDYALNEATFAMNLGGEGTPYGDLVAYQYNIDDDTSGWVSFDADVAANEVNITIDDMNFVCAEYVNGYVFAQAEDGTLYGFRYEDMLLDSFDLETCYIAQLDNVYQDLAYSYVEGKLLGLYTYTDRRGYPTSEVLTINLRGEYYDEDLWTNVAPYQEDWFCSRGGVYGLTMAVDEAGTIYVLGPNYDWDTETLGETAHLWSAPREEVVSSWGSYVEYFFEDQGDIGLSMDYLQSMTWDHNTDTLYWARFDAQGIGHLISELYTIDPANITEVTDENGEITYTVGCTKVGDLTSETCALFAPLSKKTIISNKIYANVPAMKSSEVGTPILRDDVVTMNVGGIKTLIYDLDPWYTDHKEVVWSSSDESVVTVTDGVITAVNAGSAVITVANASDEAKCDTVTVEVTALDLKLEGVISAQTAGVGATLGVSTYAFTMVDGVSEFGTINGITAPSDLNYGLSLATSVMGRGSIWACEYGNTGMIYEINPATGEVVDVLQPIDGDMLFGMTYSEKYDTFAGIMNMYLFADLELTHEETEKMMNSYDEEFHGFTYHRINLLPYLIESNDGFLTGETGQGASSEVVFCGITTLDGDFWYEDTYRDYLGNWDYNSTVNYTADQTLLLLDNVGRLWYIDEIIGMTKTADEWGNAEYTSENGSYIMHYGQFRNGMFELEVVDDEGNVTYNVFNIRKIEETPLTEMFRQGTMPRITYHFSDIELAGYTSEGAPMIAMSLYDYWNNGTTNELYLYIPGVGTGEWVMDYETWESYEVMTPSRFYNLGNTGEHNIIATIHSAEVTGGVEPETADVFTPNALASGFYKESSR